MYLHFSTPDVAGRTVASLLRHTLPALLAEPDMAAKFELLPAPRVDRVALQESETMLNEVRQRASVEELSAGVARLDSGMQDLPAVDGLNLEPPDGVDVPANSPQEAPPAEEAAASAASSAPELAPLAFDLPLASTEEVVAKMLDNIFKNVITNIEIGEATGRIGKMQIKEPKRYSPYRRGGEHHVQARPCRVSK